MLDDLCNASEDHLVMTLSEFERAFRASVPHADAALVTEVRDE